jgi:hypothetical protein
MKGLWNPKSVCLLIMILFALTGCKPKGEGKSNDFKAELHAGGSRREGDLPLKVVKTFENQKPLEEAPWHTDGGEWTFMECHSKQFGDADVVIGVKTAVRSKADPHIPTTWGEAMIAVSDAAQGDRFMDAFGRAFLKSSPAQRDNKPPLFLKMHTAVLGSQMKKESNSFSGSGKGSWTATKWFLSDDQGEAEVYFNYSSKEGTAEFLEKDPDYRDALMTQLCIALRDGPLPERTPENDPNLTLTDPQVTGWVRIAEKDTSHRFLPGQERVLLTTYKEGGSSRIELAKLELPLKRDFSIDLGNSEMVQQIIPSTQGIKFLVCEMKRKDPSVFSGDDPRNYWIVEKNARRPLKMESNMTNVFMAEHCISPNGKFVVAEQWKSLGKKNRSRILLLGEIETGKWKLVEKLDTSLDFAGWNSQTSHGVVLTGLSFEKGSAREAYDLDLETGALTKLDAVPPEYDEEKLLSPDKKLTVEVVEKDRLKITTLAEGHTREFMFHPDDRRSVERGCVKWLDSRYLEFTSWRTAIIDVQTLKMNYPFDRKSDIKWVEFSPDFRYALTKKEDGLYLGKVKMPESVTSVR